MSKDDSHSISFKLPSSIGSTSRIPIMYPKDYEVWVMHFEDYVSSIKNHCSSIWHVITKGRYQCLEANKPIKTQAVLDELIANNNDLTLDDKLRLQNNISAKRQLRFSLPLDTLRLIHSLDNANGIWKRLNELYPVDEDKKTFSSNNSSLIIQIIKTEPI